MKTNKALSALGMAMRAGKLATGDEIVLKAIRAGKAKLVIVANDSSDNTKKKFRDKCGSYDVALVEAYGRESLGRAIGKAERVLIAVTDVQFAQLIAGHLSPNMEVDLT